MRTESDGFYDAEEWRRRIIPSHRHYECKTAMWVWWYPCLCGKLQCCIPMIDSFIFVYQVMWSIPFLYDGKAKFKSMIPVKDLQPLTLQFAAQLTLTTNFQNENKHLISNKSFPFGVGLVYLWSLHPLISHNKHHS